MPYLQLDIGRRYPAETKRALAAQLGVIYAEVMETTGGQGRRSACASWEKAICGDAVRTALQHPCLSATSAADVRPAQRARLGGAPGRSLR